jgi:hypothetical protein
LVWTSGINRRGLNASDQALGAQRTPGHQCQCFCRAARDQADGSNARGCDEGSRQYLTKKCPAADCTHVFDPSFKTRRGLVVDRCEEISPSLGDNWRCVS